MATAGCTRSSRDDSARFNQVLSWADYPDREATITPAADVSLG
jgi:hypothetical protein